MTITVGLTHHTEYHYDREINLAPHVFRLKPAPHSRTPIQSYHLKIEPAEHFINWQQDAFGNYLARVVFPKPTKHFSFTVDLVAQMHVINPFDFFVEEAAETFPFVYDTHTAHDVANYTRNYEACPALLDFAEQLQPTKPERTVDFLVRVNQAVNALVDYTIRLEPGVQTVADTLTKKSGSCRDSAWLLVETLRAMGLAARFVSGYIVQLKADEKSLDGPSGPEEDFTDLHAWTEVYIPGAGWIGLDPTSGLFASEGHIPLAGTPEPTSAAPVTGALDECEAEFDYYNKVTRLTETPRVTKPYTEGQWAHIQDTAAKVEDALDKAQIKLTMGGEPTFISIDDYESEQWNTAADGEHKRELAHALFGKMVNEFSSGALQHYGQGKWYPGEPLPRWQYGCFWRKDGQPLWQNSSLFADPTQTGTATLEQARDFTSRLVDALGLPENVVVPAYEDIAYHLWQEASLPVEPSPEDPELLDQMTRKRFLQRMDEGIEKPSGYVIPVAFDQHHQAWESSLWQFKRGYCFLLPGDSPVGYRLPLGSLTPAEPTYPFDWASIKDELQANDIRPGFISERSIHTAAAVEVRNGNLHVFLPPLQDGESFIAFIRAVEISARQLDLPVILEGYSPPKDPRFKHFAVTPDPGVIEVNIHPASCWFDLEAQTTKLYELAKSVRLGTEKYMVDGRHTGTGGGNHVTLGGATMAQSPFLKRPDVLRSFITYWQHHPGLSYLFSGAFIGPTSQAPRVDEARDELLYELEIAFAQMPEGEVCQPWLVDRLLRNLLVDLTGNTHRAEFCIDKLYSPDSPAGRLGIVEFRGFEMPPHAQMSLMQMLLIRALLVKFWHQPYHKPLVRWGTVLHDKFMLPHFVKEDIKQVCDDLQAFGFDIRVDLFDPFFEFRFPTCGQTQLGPVQLTLKNAIEPWHVMGEEASSSGTARYVDSSLERVEISMHNAEPNRYVVSCNGRRVPIHPTETQGVFAAGIRFRAWQPPSALHPTIGVHAPLIFDVWDTWNDRSIGGLEYHVAHPGGRSFEAFPVNGLEAEGRRIARLNNGHTANAQVLQAKAQQQPTYFAQVASQYAASTDSDDGGLSPTVNREADHQQDGAGQCPPLEPLNPDYPCTLDLRRAATFFV